jgi:prepilin-type processing-associated H-X9-DG protein
MTGGNSANHDGAGQNILFGDGHVEFNTSAFAGMKRDNIYTVSGATDGTTETSKDVWGSPRWAGDSVLLPTAQEKGDEKAAALSKAVAPKTNFWGTTTRPAGGATTQPTTRPFGGGGPTTRPALRPIGR